MPRKKGSSGSATLDPPQNAPSEPDPALAESPEPEPASATVEEMLPSDEQPSELSEANLVADEPLAEQVAQIISAASPAESAPAPADLAPALEAILFASPEPVSLKKLADCLETDAKIVREAMNQLMSQLTEQGRGIQILEVPGGYQMATRERFSDHIYRLGNKKKKQALSNATLETLAIIAYRQPVIRAVVESIRGVESSGTVRNLLDMGLIEINGYKEVIGRPPMYGTTDKFLRAFGLRSLADLPSIRGLKERFADDEPPPRAQPQFIPPAPPIGEAAEPETGGASTPEGSEPAAEATDASEGPEIIEIIAVAAAVAVEADPLDTAAQELAERMEAAGEDDEDDSAADEDDEEFDDEDDEELDEDEELDDDDEDDEDDNLDADEDDEDLDDEDDEDDEEDEDDDK